MTNQVEFFSNDKYKRLLQIFVNESDRSINNLVEARLYREAIECYIMTYKYNISVKDILQQNLKYKLIIKRINTYNLLYAKWKFEFQKAR